MTINRKKNEKQTKDAKAGILPAKRKAAALAGVVLA